MSEAQITPELVVELYKSTGIRPEKGELGVWPDPSTGKWEKNYGGGCCVMGIALLGRPFDQKELDVVGTSEYVQKQLGVSFTPFYLGFDMKFRLDEYSPDSSVWRDPESFHLGRACREAVLAAGYVL